MLAAPAARAQESALLATDPQHALPAPAGATAQAGDDGAGYSLMTREIVTGAAVVGGALLLGLAATGSLASGLTAASAVLIIYSVLP